MFLYNIKSLEDKIMFCNQPIRLIRDFLRGGEEIERQRDRERQRERERERQRQRVRERETEIDKEREREKKESLCIYRQSSVKNTY